MSEPINGAASEACSNCRFFGGPPVNHCRRHSPVALHVGFRVDPEDKNKQQPAIGSYWPQTTAQGWCGDYQSPMPGVGSARAAVNSEWGALAGIEPEGSA